MEFCLLIIEVGILIHRGYIIVISSYDQNSLRIIIDLVVIEVFMVQSKHKPVMHQPCQPMLLYQDQAFSIGLFKLYHFKS
jgi:hypothetical protein